MKRGIFIALILAAFFGLANATNYYIKPDGDDTKSGLDTTNAWATLNRAERQGVEPFTQALQPGDTVFIMGGCYQTGQFYDYAPYISGTAGNPIVFKAYGDSVAVFEYSGGTGRHTRQNWYFDEGQDYITIDGFSHLSSSDSLYIKLNGREDASYLILFEGSSTNRCIACNVKGIEIDGQFPSTEMIASGDTVGGLLRYAIGWEWGDKDTLLSCYIHDVYHPTGNIPPGDSSDAPTYAQGTGESIMLHQVNRIYMARNRLVNANHALVSSFPRYSTSPFGFGNKFVNNLCSNSWGGGIYCIKEHFWLIDGNIIVMPNTTTTKTKGPIGACGSNFTVRRNVLYNPYNNGAIDVHSSEGQGIGNYQNIGSNIYNNVVYGTKYYDIGVLINVDKGNDPVQPYMTDAVVANNIMYMGRPIAYSSMWNWYPSLKLWTLGADAVGDWEEPSMSGVWPMSTHFGRNRFHNNCMLKDSVGAGYDRAIGYASNWVNRPGWSVAGAAVADSVAFKDNIEYNPLLTNAFTNKTTDLDTLFSDWWKITWDSPCIDNGVAVDDTNGTHVEAYYAALGESGYGWDTLVYYGEAPDIGAYEYVSVDTLAAPNLVIEPGAYLFYGSVKSTEKDTLGFWVKNDCLVDTCETATIAPYVSSGDTEYSVLELAAADSTLEGNDSIVVYVELDPNEATGALIAHIKLYVGALDSVPAFGVSYADPDPCARFVDRPNIAGMVEISSIAFGTKYLLSTSLDTVYLSNCGEVADTLFPSWSLYGGLHFSVISAPDTVVAVPPALPVIIQYKPVYVGSLADSLICTAENGRTAIYLTGSSEKPPATKSSSTREAEE